MKHSFPSNASKVSAIMLSTFALALIIIGSVTHASGASRTANSISELQSLVNTAKSGDTVYLANGTYPDSSIIIGTSNITVSAATPGGVTLTGTVSIVITGNSNKFSGFQFKSGGSSVTVIDVRGSRNLLTQLNFSGYSAHKYVVFQDGTQYNEISYSNFENKPATAPIGNLIHVAAHATIPGYHKIRYSSFQNMPGAGGDNGNENIRLSNGAQSAYVSRTTVEFNYFSNTGQGDSEAISVKCRENVLRYNTFKNNPDAMLVFRNGNDNIAYGNYFIDAGGIRVKEANNIYVYNNYFERSGIGGSMNAVTYDYVSGNLKNVNFIHNTFVDSGTIDFSIGATDNTWANNIFVKSSGNLFSGSMSGITLVNNIFWGSALASFSGMTKADPKLALNSDGYYALTSNSPAINAGSSNFPALIDVLNVDDDPTLRYDISLQLRDGRKDIGSDEFLVGDRINRPLTVADVGPSYLGGPSAIISKPQPPASPILSMLSATKSSITLNWVQDTSVIPVTGFEILRCTGKLCTPNSIIASVNSSTRSFTNSGLARLTTYTYAVRAKNSSAWTQSNLVSGSAN